MPAADGEYYDGLCRIPGLMKLNVTYNQMDGWVDIIVIVLLHVDIC